MAKLPAAPGGSISIGTGRKFARPGRAVRPEVKPAEEVAPAADSEEQAIKDWPYRYRPFCRVREDRESSMGSFTNAPYCVDILLYPWLPAAKRRWTFAGRFKTKDEAEMHIASLVEW